MRSLFSNRYDNKRKDFYDRYEAARALHPSLPPYERPKEPDQLVAIDRSRRRRFKSYQELSKQSTEKYTSDEWLGSDRLSIVVRRTLEERNFEELMPKYDPTAANHEFSHNARFRQRGRRPNASTMARIVSDFAQQVGGVGHEETEDEDSKSQDSENSEVVIETKRQEGEEDDFVEQVKPRHTYNLLNNQNVKLQLPKIKKQEEVEEKSLEQVKPKNTYSIQNMKLQLPKIKRQEEVENKSVEQVKPKYTYNLVDIPKQKLQLPKIKKQEEVQEKVVELVKPKTTFNLNDIPKQKLQIKNQEPEKKSLEKVNPQKTYNPLNIQNSKLQLPKMKKQAQVEGEFVELVKPPGEPEPTFNLIDIPKQKLPLSKIKKQVEVKEKVVDFNVIDIPKQKLQLPQMKRHIEVKEKAVEQMKPKTTFNLMGIPNLQLPKFKGMPNLKREFSSEDSKENMPAEKQYKFTMPPRIFICPEPSCQEEFDLRRCLSKHQRDTGHHSWSHKCDRCGQIFRTAGFMRMHALGACDRNLQKNSKQTLSPEKFIQL